MSRVWIAFLSYGPMHIARLDACQRRKSHRYIAVSASQTQGDYGWERQGDRRIVALEGERDFEDVPASEWYAKIEALWESDPPDAVCVAGYSHPSMLSLISVCLDRRVPWVVMGDSQYVDHVRFAWREYLKARVLRSASSALVAGTPHVDYFRSLGLSRDLIFTGYDVVDNAYFASKAKPSKEPGPGFLLSCSRFIPKKNLFRVLSAYRSYIQMCERSSGAICRDFVLLGDGELRSDLIEHAIRLGLRIRADTCLEEVKDHGKSRGKPTVFLPGFRQIHELPSYYGNAVALVHASTSEQWGLVVNEAMASGLPVIVSNRCGCAMDLVRVDVNGWIFGPRDVDTLAGLMFRVSAMPDSMRLEMGLASQAIIQEWGPERFADGIGQAVDCALRDGPRSSTFLDRALVATLQRR
jgi:glycosyltransferase involved in cell wall biosynthesis